ncbi:SAV_2336 N-terminal domain-related protein [cf. Phormidesmis sp. LEGE 11477]|uniref:SAV_2336 N-terminal domain-related protein n=1 Tax=cf. Phormidesmis sp. LEGE 11477 TaxID=1828680 RepID=UPI00187F6993|nr:SAV_2336 N-terminal domain-related protein [cf. Phormidesmis sp. LEGE 11477]MBE9062377.1 SUMF1/EgtB/PvdO family nonheme iron enzyme [cf. Phormidesmis sp. LEGE 11477]
MIEQLVAALEQKYQDLTAEEISDILWLALQQWQSAATTVEKIEPVEEDPLQSARAEDTAAEKMSSFADSLPVEPPERSRPQTSGTAGVTTRPAQETAASASIAESASPLAIPDSTALRRSLELLKAIRPLIRLVPSTERTYLDVPATVKAIAETDLWLLKERPLLEPWLELALVIDATPSMAIWQRTILRLRRVLAQSGVFRDVRLWSLTSALPVNDLAPGPDRQLAQRLCLRSGFGLAAVCQAPCRPQELLDPKGRRLILVVSDCIDPRWDEQPIRDILQVWAKRGPLGLVQVLPEWLWSRTALDEVTKGQMTADRAGQPSQSLRFMRRDRWQRQTTGGVKVPVMTLEPAVASRWSQMVAGRTSVSVPGLVFSAVTVGQLASELNARTQDSIDSSTPELTAQERMTQFRDFSSPLARRLAGLLAACPEINLPVIRMVQAALLTDSQQVHVAEVLFGGLFKPQKTMSAYAPADQVQYIFHEGVRPLAQDTVLPEHTFAALSEWLNKRFGYGLEDFQAYLTSKGTEEIKPFAGILLDVLRRRGGEHADLINRIERVYQPRYGSFSELVQEEAAVQDYEIRSRQGTSGVVILAIHGGNIQPGTTQIADAVAGDFHSFYSFVSLKPETGQSLYVPSTQFDEPTAVEMIREADTVLSIHGCKGKESFIKVGGRDRILQDSICSALAEAGFSLSDADPGGIHPDNICNRGKTGQGVQIQISRGLRNRLIESASQVKEAERFGLFSELQRSLQRVLLARNEEDVEFPELEAFDFLQAQFGEAPAFPPPLLTEKFTVRTLTSAPTVKKILFLAANPQSMSRLRLGAKIREIEEGLRRSRMRDAFTFEQMFVVQLGDLQRALLETSPNVVHISGAGGGEPGVIFENARGEPTRVSSTALAELFRPFADQVNCVVLNGCYARAQAEAIAQHIPYVIGWDQFYAEQAAVEFAVGFFEALGADRSIEFAYQLGCNAIELSGMANSLPVFIQKAGTQSTDEPKSTDRLETFEFMVATLNRVDGQWQVRRSAGQARRFIEVLSEEVNLEMIAISGGSFSMGSASGYSGLGPQDEYDSPGYVPPTEDVTSESSQHEVTVKPFFMSHYPVTQAQWKVVAAMPQVRRPLNPDPFQFKEAMLPVERVSWYDAVEFCDRLSSYTEREYRLPTEAEWEYACRAGTSTAFHFGKIIDTEVANYDGRRAYENGPEGEYRRMTTPIDQFGIANAYGLSDMHGNVWEWCQDHWHSNYEGAPADGSAWLTNNERAGRVRRGGSWLDLPGYCRSASRSSLSPESRHPYLGFRVSCAAPRALTNSIRDTYIDLLHRYESEQPNKLREDIMSALSQKFEDIEIWAEAVPSFGRHEQEEVTSDVKGFTFESPIEMIDFSEEILVASSTLNVDVDLEFTFSFVIYDSIDKEELSLGNGTASSEANFGVEIKIHFVPYLKEKEMEIDWIDVEIVSIPDIDLGEIEPDNWSE